MDRDRRRMVGDEAGEEAGDATAQDLVGQGSANPSRGQTQPTAFLVNKVLLEHRHVYLLTCELWLLLCFFVLFGMVSTETIWSTKPKIFTIWFLQKRLSTPVEGILF